MSAESLSFIAIGMGMMSPILWFFIKEYKKRNDEEHRELFLRFKELSNLYVENKVEIGKMTSKIDMIGMTVCNGNWKKVRSDTHSNS